MRRILLLLVGLGVFLLGVLPASVARADSDDDRIDKYTVTTDVAKDGTAAVQIAFDFNFGSDSGHGPYLSLPLRQEIANDPDHWRMIDITLGKVTSPSGRARRCRPRPRTAT